MKDIISHIKRIAKTTFTLVCFAVSLSTSAQTVEFNHQHGFYDAPFTLRITSKNTDGIGEFTIRYTTDGSNPTPQSKLYTAPLKITGNIVLRAAVVDSEDIVYTISTATYLFAFDVMNQPAAPKGYPSTWGDYCQIEGTAMADYEMDPEMTGNKTLSPKIQEGLTAIPTLSIVTDKNNFFSHENDPETGGIYIYTGTPTGDGTGRDWVRPISMELFGGDQHHDVTADCCVKIHGGHSRLAEKTPKHSLRIMFKSSYGESKLKYKIFGDDGPEKFDQLVLRSSFGNTWEHWDSNNRSRAQYIRDMWARATQNLMGHPSSRGLFVHLYINGLYWGLYNIAERIDNYYCSSNFGGQKTQYDVIKVEEDHTSHSIEAGDGDMEKWNQMMELVEQSASSNLKYFQLTGCDTDGMSDSEVETLLDVDNFIDFMLINQYAGNTDWDHHNWLAFKNRDLGDKGFRFICWDSELIFGDLNANNLSLNNDGAPTYMLNRLMKNPNFKHRYMDRVYKHLIADGGLLTPKKVVEVWDSLYNIVQLPLYDEAARWGDYRRDVHPYQSYCWEVYTVDNQYNAERQRLLTKYFPQRTKTFINQLIKKEWYIESDIPVFRINGMVDDETDTLTQDDVLTFKSTSIVYYTTDGTNPVVWKSSNGTATPTARRYNGRNILENLDYENNDEITIRAVCKTGNEWGIVADRTFIMSITEKTGDVNGDGEIDISDVVAVINHIAKTATYEHADVNHDDSVDISDIVAIINIIAE